MRIVLPNNINTLGVRPKIPDTRKAKLVCQGEFAITRASSQRRSIKTFGYGECIIIDLVSPLRRTVGLAHFDINTLVKASFEKIILPEFYKFDCTDLQARIVGGNGGETSQKLATKIRDACLANKIKIIGTDVNNPKGSPGLMIDAETLDLYDIRVPRQRDEKRIETAMRYIMHNPNGRLIRLVEELRG